MKEKKIEFTDDQYKTLIRLLFYGEWILNANKIKAEESNKDAANLVEYISSQNEIFSLKTWFKDLKYGEELKEEIVMNFLDKVFEYNEDTFWIYLIRKMAFRDARKEHLKNGGKIIDKEEITNLHWQYLEKYEKEFKNREIDDLFMNEK